MDIKTNRYNSSGLTTLIAVSIFVSLFFFFGFDDIFFAHPQGMHFMRQTDSLSFASQYVNNGFDFFRPQLYNLKNFDGRAACEFPILYFVTSILFTVFGKQFFFLKLINLLIVYFGVFYLFKLVNRLVKDRIYAALIVLFLFTSTVFNYYSFNYLPDPAALGLTFIGWYFVFKFQDENKKKDLLKAFVFFAIAGLIKVTYAMNPLTIMVLAGYSLLFKKGSLLKKTSAKKILTYGLISILIIAAWNIYVISYNAYYESNSFNTEAHPIWKLSWQNIQIIWQHVSEYWYTKYFAQTSFHIIFAAILLNIIFYKKSNKKLSLSTLILLFGSIAYFLLFYSLFKQHDYYFLAFFPLIVLILTNLVVTLKNLFTNKIIHLVIKVALSIVVITGINYARIHVDKRVEKGNIESAVIGFLIEKNRAKLNELNLAEDARIIITPDESQNGAFLFLDRMGWIVDDQKTLTLKKIESLKKEGATHLFLATNNKRIQNLGLKCGKLLLDGDGLWVYEL